MEEIKFYAYLDDVDVVTLIVDERYYHQEDQLSIYHYKELIPFEKHQENLYDGVYKLTLRVLKEINLREEWKITLDESLETEIVSGKVVRTKSFIDQNNYQKDDLGFDYHKTHTDFRIWAPISKKVNLILENNNQERSVYDLSYDKQGVWHVRVDGDLESCLYHYQVYVNGGWKRVKDPYAMSSNANGEWAYIIDPSKVYQPKSNYLNKDLPIIYEVSVRDFSSDPNIDFKNPKQYLGMIEEGLQTDGTHPLGFDYVKTLGISHIQLMPVYDFTGVDENKPNESYNWGYNPSQYFVPEGSYSSKPNHPYQRINELRTLIDTYHQAGIGVIMDVVYNHVDQYDIFPYEILVPGYSFRLDDLDIMTDFSGCGNDLNTSRPMIRKLIIDSLKHWMVFYKMDGFRFDLMGLIDYETMNKAYEACKSIREDILFYGEGWKIDQNSKLAHMFNPKVDKNIKFFNDQFRDSLKGSTFNVLDKGFIFGNMQYQKIVNSLMEGKGHISPDQSINYIECHDNHTVFDKGMTIFNNEDLVEKHQLIGTCLTILFPGIPFMHLGQEFYRSKSFVENSYNESDSINRVTWNALDAYWHDIEMVKQMIRLRKKISSIQIDDIDWYDFGFSIRIGQYIFYCLVEEGCVSLPRDYTIYTMSSPIEVMDDAWVLKDIGIYIFEGSQNHGSK